MTRFTEEDVGSSVFDADREKIGVVVSVEDGTAYLDPEPSRTEELKAKLDWGDPEPDEDAYALRREWIDELNDDEVLLRTRPEE